MALANDMSYVRKKDPVARGIGVVVVILLHIGIVYALIAGLAHQMVEKIAGPLETRIIKEVKPPPKDEPPPPPELAPPPPPYIPPPEVNVQAPPSTNSNAISVVTSAKPVPKPPPPVVKAAPKVTAPNTSSAGRTCKPEYPTVSRDLQEDGIVVVRITVAADGSVTNPTIITSSGHSRLDRAMMEKVVGCKFPPGTVDGKPAALQTDLRYRFQLED